MKTPKNKIHIQLMGGRWRIYGPLGKPSHEAKTKLFVKKLNTQLTKQIRNQLKQSFYPNSDYAKKSNE